MNFSHETNEHKSNDAARRAVDYVQRTFWNSSSIALFRHCSVSIGSATIWSVNKTMFSGDILLRMDVNFFRVSLQMSKQKIIQLFTNRVYRFRCTTT